MPKSMSSGSGSSTSSVATSKLVRGAERVPPTSASNQPSSTSLEDRSVKFSTSDLNDKRPMTLAPDAHEGVISSHPNHEEAGCKMGCPTTSPTPESDCKHDRVPTTAEESDDEYEPEEFKIHGQSLRPGRLPS